MVEYFLKTVPAKGSNNLNCESAQVHTPNSFEEVIYTRGLERELAYLRCSFAP
jgi:hypothetical protein